MKKMNSILCMLLGFALIFGAASCSDDDPVIPGGGDGIPVADGFYLAKAGEDPVSTAQLKEATVDAPDFAAMARPGFYQNYVYLTAGSYNVVEVTSKEITQTLGGTATQVSGEEALNKECDESGYTVVNATVDGASFAIATEGLYVVTYDTDTEEIVYDQMTSMGIIGGGTPLGWGSDTDLVAGTVNADGGTWTLTDVTLSVGQMKFRYNCRWSIDRRIDPTAALDNANGYVLFTNYGNTIANLLPGNEGPNIEIAERAVYTVTFKWNPKTGVSATLVKTGEAEETATYPDAMYLVGAATAYAWETPGTVPNAVFHEIAGGAINEGIFWKIAYLEAGQGFKISAANWLDPYNLGVAEVDEFDANGVAVTGLDGGNDMSIAESGMYMIVVNFQDEMTKVSIVVPEVYGTGDAFGGFDNQTPEKKYTVDNVNKTIVSPALLAASAVRTYVYHDWIPAWWNAEFVVVDGAIEYRNNSDSDPTSVAVTAGQVQTFMFDDNTGSIE